MEELAFAGDVAAVALGGDVFAEGGDGLAGDDSGADGGLEGDFELVFVDLLFQPFDDGAAAAFGEVAVDDHREGFDLFAFHEDVQLDEVRLVRSR